MAEAGSQADRRASGSELVRESERASGSELVRESERARGGERARESERARGGGESGRARLANGGLRVEGCIPSQTALPRRHALPSSRDDGSESLGCPPETTAQRALVAQELAADSRLATASRARARGGRRASLGRRTTGLCESLSLAAATAAAALWGTAARESANADAPGLTECPRSAGAGQNEAEAACKRAREHPRARRRAERLLARVGLRASRAAVGERARQGAAARGGGERPLREMAGERVR